MLQNETPSNNNIRFLLLVAVSLVYTPEPQLAITVTAVGPSVGTVMTIKLIRFSFFQVSL